jgi:hypothetical protein
MFLFERSLEIDWKINSIGIRLKNDSTQIIENPTKRVSSQIIEKIIHIKTDTMNIFRLSFSK